MLTLMLQPQKKQRSRKNIIFYSWKFSSFRLWKFLGILFGWEWALKSVVKSLEEAFKAYSGYFVLLLLFPLFYIRITLNTNVVKCERTEKWIEARFLQFFHAVKLNVLWHWLSLYFLFNFVSLDILSWHFTNFSQDVFIIHNNVIFLWAQKKVFNLKKIFFHWKKFLIHFSKMKKFGNVFFLFVAYVCNEKFINFIRNSIHHKNYHQRYGRCSVVNNCTRRKSNQRNNFHSWFNSSSFTESISHRKFSHEFKYCTNSQRASTNSIKH